MGYLLLSVDFIYGIIKEWQVNKFDGLIVIDGNRGLGKSTLALKIATKEKDFRIKRDVLFSRDEIIKALSKKRNAMLVADEMINVTYNRDFYSEDQKKLIKMLNMYRDSCNCLIACVPNFYDLDRQFRNLCKMRINIQRRGFAVVHTKNQTSFVVDKWDCDTNAKVERKWMKNGIAKPRYTALSTYRGVVKFGDLRVKQRRIYEEVKQKKRNIVFETEVDKGNEYLDYNGMYEKLKSAEMDKEGLKQWCYKNRKNMSSVLRTLSNYCKLDGISLSDLLPRDENKKILTVSNSVNSKNRKLYKAPVI